MSLPRRLAWLTPVFFALALSAALPPRPAGYVTDEAGVLSAADKARLETLLSDLERTTSNEVAVVTLKSLEGRTVEDAAVELFRDWGIGKKGRDNGVLFLIAPADRRMRIEVGYGLEGALPDSKVGRIRDERIIPAFRSGDLGAGVVAGTEAIVATLGGPGEPVSDAPRHAKRDGGVLALLLLVFIFLIFRHPWLLLFMGLPGGGRHRGGWGGGGFGGGWGGGGFGGFGGGMSGGGGASGRW